MQPNPSDSKDLPSDFSRPARFGAAQGRDLLETQVRLLRGLATRWQKLSDSFAVDSVVLSEKTQALQGDFRQRASQIASEHKRQIHELLTEWDEQLDRVVGKAELGTLEKTQWERQTLKTLKAKLSQGMLMFYSVVLASPLAPIIPSLFLLSTVAMASKL